MGRLVTLSVKIPRELKEKMEKLGLKPSEIVRRALEEAVREAELRELEKKLDSIGDVLAKIPPERIVESIREDREGR